jgi:hypothetical protein
MLATVLLIRCDYTILLNFLNDQKSENRASSPKIEVDMSINRQECETLITESCLKHQPRTTDEGRLYWAKFLALERSFSEAGLELAVLIHRTRIYVQLAYRTCDEHPVQTAGMRNETDEVEKMLRDMTFYMPVRNDEKAAVYAAWHTTSEAQGIGIIVKMVTHLRLESVACRWKHPNVHTVALRLVVGIIGLLMVFDRHPTWSNNLVDSEFEQTTREMFVVLIYLHL